MFELDQMDITAENIVLVAKQHKIEELTQLAATADFVEVISNLIHSLQAERGSSCLYLASAGQKFTKTKQEIIHESRILTIRLRELLAIKLAQSTYANAKLLTLMAWVLIGLDDLAVLRQNIHAFKLTPIECIDAYSRLIASLIALIFDVADTAVDPRISYLLVALFNLVQGKELAGQERAFGCYAFASGKIEPQYKQRILHAIDTQTRYFEVFCEFAKPTYVEQWHQIERSDSTKCLHQLRAQLTMDSTINTLDHQLSELWFKHCSERLTDIWTLECALIHRIKSCSANLIAEAEVDLQNAHGLLANLRKNPPSNASLVDRFFDPTI
ncbi:MAG: nitrate- and nitrite sensing domain-containing protein, partial [Ferruginibacter sp.]